MDKRAPGLAKTSSDVHAARLKQARNSKLTAKIMGFIALVAAVGTVAAGATKNSDEAVLCILVFCLLVVGRGAANQNARNLIATPVDCEVSKTPDRIVLAVVAVLVAPPLLLGLIVYALSHPR